MRIKALTASCFLVLLTAGGALGQSTSVEGSYRDRYGTIFAISQCGEGSDICAVLKELRGDSRTVENLAFLNRMVLQARQTEANRYEGTLNLDGMQARATITREDADSLTIRGCRSFICASLEFVRI